MAKFKLFMPLTKVDASQRTVTGVFTQEVNDRSREIMDYETSKPFFEAWSQSLFKTSGGKNFGNVREMHEPKAVGCFVEELEFDDSNKCIKGTARILDDTTWEKVEAGVLTGFSVGGNYAKRWQDSKNPSLRRYTADPQEVSLVDLPCVPTANFDYVKVLGGQEVHEQRLFKSVAASAEQATPAFEAVDEEGSPAAGGNTEGTSAAGASGSAATNTLEKSAPAEGGAAAPAATAPADDVEQVWLAKDGKPFKKKADALAHNEQLTVSAAVAEATAPVTSALAELTNLVKGTTTEGATNGTQPASAAAGATPETATAATPATPGLAKVVGDLGTGVPSNPSPPVEGSNTATGNRQDYQISGPMIPGWTIGMMRKAIALPWTKTVVDDSSPVAIRLTKGLYDVTRVADILCSMNWLLECITNESIREKDGSPLPARLQEIVNEVCMFLRAIVVEETAELMNGTDDSDDETDTIYVTLMAGAGLKAGSMAKSLTDGMKGVDFATLKQPEVPRLIKFLERMNIKLGKSASSPESDTTMPSSLRKVLAENAGMRSELQALGSQVTEVVELVKKIAATPIPGGGFTKGATPPAQFFAVPKTSDGAGAGTTPTLGIDPNNREQVVDAFEKHLEGLDHTEAAKVLMKMSLRNPQRVER